MKGLVRSIVLDWRNWIFTRFEAFAHPQSSIPKAQIPFRASVPQGSVLGPILFTFYTADIPTHPATSIYTFTDDFASLPLTLIHEIHPQPYKSLLSLRSWRSRWRVKVNETKSAHITLVLRRGVPPRISLNTIPIPSPDQIRCLGLYLDKSVIWNPHTWLKRIDLNRRYGLLRKLL